MEHQRLIMTERYEQVKGVNTDHNEANKDQQPCYLVFRSKRTGSVSRTSKVGFGRERLTIVALLGYVRRHPCPLRRIVAEVQSLDQHLTWFQLRQVHCRQFKRRTLP